MRPPPPQMAMELSKRRVQPRRGDFGEGDVEDRSLSQDPYVAFAVDCGLCDRVALPNPLRRRDEGPYCVKCRSRIAETDPDGWGVAGGGRPRRPPKSARRGNQTFGGEPIRLLAPAGSAPGDAQWVEVPTGRPVADDEVAIATYGDELVRLVLHPESKMLGPGGQPCRYTTRGLLTPRPVRVAAIHIVGKEGNRIDEVATGEVTDPDEILNDYGDDAWESLVLPVGRLMGIRRLSRETGLDRSQLIDVFQGRSNPRPTARTLVADRVATWAAAELGLPTVPDDRNAAFAALLAERSQ